MKQTITINDLAKRSKKAMAAGAPQPKKVSGRKWKKRDLEPVTILNPDEPKEKR